MNIRAESYPTFDIDSREWWVNEDFSVDPPRIVKEPISKLPRKLTIRIDYPVNRSVEFTREDDWTWLKFANFVADCYEEVYKNPDNIWGHEIGQLVLEGGAYHRGAVWIPMIGS